MKGLGCLSHLAKYQTLFIRISLLFVLFAHGWSKLVAGPERWIGLGEAMATYGITFFPVFRGFMAAYAESIAVIMIALGIFTRYHAFFLWFTMLTVILMKTTGGGIERLGELSAAVYIFVAAFAVFMTGAGKYFNLEKMIFGKEY